MSEQSGLLKKTPLYDVHEAMGGRLVPFAGYALPVQFEGIMAEHLWTRKHAGLFDVSHMGQFVFRAADWQTLATELEKLMPCDLLGLKPGRQRYTQILNDKGGILDDLIVGRLPDNEGEARAFMVVNGACKNQDFLHFQNNLPEFIHLSHKDNKVLLALQGPEARQVLSGLIPACETMSFMSLKELSFKGRDVLVSCSGYTGEDGFELSCDPETGLMLANSLLALDQVRSIGLGARDSLRLEAGLCLYGHDMDETVSPVEAGLVWSIPKRRRSEGGFRGDEVVLKQIVQGAHRIRIGLQMLGRQPAREGAEIVIDGQTVGRITSGGFSPSLQTPIAMGLMDSDKSSLDQAVQILIRGKAIEAKLVSMPFVPHSMRR
jgi:aminomethyltransferase